MTETRKPMMNIFTLSMVTASFIMAIRNFPTLAQSGFQAIFFCLVATITFVIPAALVSAELATGWPKQGGIYVWIKEAFGPKWGLVALFMQWVENIIWFPTALSFIGGTLAIGFFPHLANNKYYLLGAIIFIYWATTLLNLSGMKISAWISSFCVIVGIFIPSALIIFLATVYLMSGSPIHLSFAFSDHAFIPDMSNLGYLTIFLGFVFAFTGLEASAVHAADVKNPRRNYPIAIFLMALVLIFINIAGSLSIAIVVPQKEISLVSGVMDAFGVFLDAFHLRWAIPLAALLLAIGSLGQVSSWIVGPSRGLLVTAHDGLLPLFFHRITKTGMPSRILFVQGIILTFLSFVFLFMPSINSSYWILLALTSIVYMIMYFLMFLAVIKLRYSKPKVERAYKIPGGKLGVWIIAGLGSLCSLFTMFIGFFPPKQLASGSLLFYELFLWIGTIVMMAIPLLIYRFRKPHWVDKNLQVH